MRGMCDAPSRALARRRRPSVPRPHSLTHEPQAGPSCIPSLMDPRWAYMSVFVFDVNTLGVVHVPHLRKPNGRGRETGVASGRRARGAARRAAETSAQARGPTGLHQYQERKQGFSTRQLNERPERPAAALRVHPGGTSARPVTASHTRRTLARGRCDRPICEVRL
jgi:hypothetical protein